MSSGHERNNLSHQYTKISNQRGRTRFEMFSYGENLTPEGEAKFLASEFYREPTLREKIAHKIKTLFSVDF